ncbi:GNAT family N-acetyltransferase [Ruegeria meonggei]|uniref:Putative acetyltransferase n=1 Tax=Ruegeria meonggei TaxID=1446476 RepID=A0A1X7AD19_9RHOB|nr:GNAT family N-acetyltransferase [Ruegeria meonggei]SLN76886.1 putative acetyltransferase [Ruegeria meonggei]
MSDVTEPDTTLWRVAADDPALHDVLVLVRAAFQDMDGRIDPPSSAHHLTVDNIQAHCRKGGEVWAIGQAPVGCMFLTPKPTALHLGKLAVREDRRGHGLCRALVDHAERRAIVLGLPALELETRVELTEIHRVFSRLGFTVVNMGTHTGYTEPTEYQLRKVISSSADS